MSGLNPQGWSAEAMTQRLVGMFDKQQQLLEAMTKREVKVGGIRLPQFYGEMEESVDLYFEQLAQYFEAKNIHWQADAQSSRILAITTAYFKGNDAAWHKMNKRDIKGMQGLIARLADGFGPPDLQERLRDQLYALKQTNCPDLEESLSRFREAIMQVTDMSELDKITYFTRGLLSPTREEVQYRRCTTVSQAMKIALEYYRSHHIRGKNNRPPFYSQDRSRSPSNGNQHQQQSASAQGQANEPEPMEIDSGYTRNRRSSSSSSSSSKRYRYCKKPGHVIEHCYKLKNKEKNARQNRHGQSSANFTAAPVAQISTAPLGDEVTIVEVEEISTFTLSPVHHENKLIRKQGTCDGKPVVIMVDSGATCNVVRPGLVDNVTNSGVSQVTRFDGTAIRARSVKKGVATQRMRLVSASTTCGPDSIVVETSRPAYNRFSNASNIIANDERIT